MLDEPENDVLPATADRFERRRADIISAAIPVLNGHVFQAMRLTDIRLTHKSGGKSGTYEGA